MTLVRAYAGYVYDTAVPGVPNIDDTGIELDEFTANLVMNEPRARQYVYLPEFEGQNYIATYPGPPGPPGTPGAPGAVGPPGRSGAGARRWYGSGPPLPGQPVGAAPDDEYLDTSNGDLYVLNTDI